MLLEVYGKMMEYGLISCIWLMPIQDANRSTNHWKPRVTHCDVSPCVANACLQIRKLVNQPTTAKWKTHIYRVFRQTHATSRKLTVCHGKPWIQTCTSCKSLNHHVNHWTKLAMKNPEDTASKVPLINSYLCHCWSSIRIFDGSHPPA